LALSVDSTLGFKIDPATGKSQFPVVPPLVGAIVGKKKIQVQGNMRLVEPRAPERGSAENGGGASNLSGIF